MIKTALIFFYCFLLFSLGCTHNHHQKYGLQRRNMNEYFLTSGVVRYFLSDIPSWANFSIEGQCFRKGSVRHLNLSELRNSFSFNYQQAIQFQYMFNRDYHKLKKEHQAKQLFFKDEEKLFYDVSDKIRSGFQAFKKPTFNRIHLIWIDQALSLSLIHI